MSTDQTPTLGTRIRTMQEAIQAEASSALDQHLDALSTIEAQTRELASISVYDDRVRESLSRVASALHNEASIIKKFLASRFPAAADQVAA